MSKLSTTLILVSLAGLSPAATIRVPQDAATIQAGIDLAKTGDTVLVAPGTYTEFIDLKGKAITLQGEGGASRTVIQSPGRFGYVVHAKSRETAATVLTGFTVRGGASNQNSNPPVPGGGMFAAGSSITVVDVVFRENHGIYGGGVHAKNGSPTFRRVAFVDNTATFGGAFDYEDSDLRMEDVRFVGNRAQFGGAVSGFGKLRIDGAYATANVGFQFGSVLYTGGGTIHVDGMLAERNGLYERGGHGGSFRSFAGGAIYTTRTSGLIVGSRFRENAAAYGAALYFAGGSPISVVNSILDHNLGNGGILVNDAMPRVVNTTVAFNSNFALFVQRGRSPIVVNSVFAFNDKWGYAAEIVGSGSAQVTSSVVFNRTGGANYSGPTVFNVDPRLDLEFRPLPDSPVIDAGNNTAVPAGIVTDFYGNPRFVDDPNVADTGIGTAPLVDIGAVERQVSPRPWPLRNSQHGIR